MPPHLLNLPPINLEIIRSRTRLSVNALRIQGAFQIQYRCVFIVEKNVALSLFIISYHCSPYVLWGGETLSKLQTLLYRV